jgi:hypothetical protein
MNIALGGGSWDHVNSNPEIRKRIADSRRGKQKPISQETKEKIAASLRGKKRRPLSEEEKVNNAKSQKTCRPIIIDGIEYLSMRLASQAFW